MAIGLARDQSAVIEQCCSRCGYRSANPIFFRKESVELLSRGKIYCAACKPPPTSEGCKSGRRPYGTASVIFFVWLGLAAVFPPPTAQALPLVAGFLVSLMISIPIHELGHAAFARFANTDVDTIQIGSGPVLKCFRWKKTKIELRLFFFKRGQVFRRPRLGASTTAGEALFILGGAIAHAGLLAVLALLVSVSHSPLVAAAAYGALFPQAANFLGNLVPSHTNDGRDLVDLLRRKNTVTIASEEDMRLAEEAYALAYADRHADAVRHAQAVLREHPHSAMAPYLLGRLLDSMTKVEEPRAIVESYLAHRHLLPSEEAIAADQADHLGWINVNAAWGAVLTGDPALLPLADALSSKALATHPDAGPMQGVRGAVLVEQGEHEKGIALLAEGLRGLGAHDESDRAKFVAFWAKGERTRGNAAMADELSRYQHYLIERAAHQAAPQASAA